jgi:hypothetical protein
MIPEGDECRHLSARPGDNLMCPFECDTCQFWKLRGHAPRKKVSHDDRLLAFIRQANLDAFWAREPATVRGNLREVKSALETGRSMQVIMFPSMGPWPSTYDHGMRTALTLLERSLKPGQHELTLKLSTVRKGRTAFTNVWRASAKGTSESLFWRIDKKRGVSSSIPTDSEWFTRFSEGLRNRLGQRTKQDAAISIEVMLGLIVKFEEDFQRAVASRDRSAERAVVESACFSMISYCASMRGYEVPKVLLSYLTEFRQEEQCGEVAPHFGLPLAGRFKLRGNMEQNLLLFVAKTTHSGLQPLRWVNRLVAVLADAGITTGWAFQRADGEQAQMADFEDSIFDKLLEIQTENPGLIPKELDVRESFGLARMFRRGATTRAQNQKVSESDIDWINRWGRQASGDPTPYFQGNMRVHYSDQRQMVQTFLRFSLAL